jgi:hypothetical protein
MGVKAETLPRLSAAVSVSEELTGPMLDGLRVLVGSINLWVGSPGLFVNSVTD